MDVKGGEGEKEREEREGKRKEGRRRDTGRMGEAG